MPGTPYTAVAAHVNIANTVVVTVPADGDTDNAATFDVGMQALADYAEALRVKRSITQLSMVLGTAISGTFASTNVIIFPQGFFIGTAVLGADATATNGTGAAHKITVNAAGIYRVSLSTSGSLKNTGTGLAYLSLAKNGVLTASAGTLGFIPASDVPNGNETYLSLAAADYIQLGFSAPAGTGTYNISGASINDGLTFTVQRIS